MLMCDTCLCVTHDIMVMCEILIRFVRCLLRGFSKSAMHTQHTFPMHNHLTSFLALKCELVDIIAHKTDTKIQVPCSPFSIPHAYHCLVSKLRFAIHLRNTRLTEN